MKEFTMIIERGEDGYFIGTVKVEILIEGFLQKYLETQN